MTREYDNDNSPDATDRSGVTDTVPRSDDWPVTVDRTPDADITNLPPPPAAAVDSAPERAGDDDGPGSPAEDRDMADAPDDEAREPVAYESEFGDLAATFVPPASRVDDAVDDRSADTPTDPGADDDAAPLVAVEADTDTEADDLADDDDVVPVAEVSADTDDDEDDDDVVPEASASTADDDVVPVDEAMADTDDEVRADSEDDIVPVAGAVTSDGAVSSDSAGSTDDTGAGVPDSTVAAAAGAGAGAEHGPLVGEPDAFRTRWQSVVVAFVDDPRQAVHDAQGLVGEVVEVVVAGVGAQHDRLGESWSSGEPDTEQLRLAMHRYRAFLERLLAV
jgi:hypothetical protein